MVFILCPKEIRLEISGFSRFYSPKRIAKGFGDSKYGIFKVARTFHMRSAVGTGNLFADYFFLNSKLS